MAGFVMATVAVRFAFPAVSAEGAAFWIIRTSPITLRDFLWSKFWTAFVPVLVLTEALTIAANEFLGDRSVPEGGRRALAIVLHDASRWSGSRSAWARATRGSAPIRARWPGRTAASRS